MRSLVPNFSVHPNKNFFRNPRKKRIFRKILMFLSHLNNDDFDVTDAEFYGFMFIRLIVPSSAKENNFSIVSLTSCFENFVLTKYSVVIDFFYISLYMLIFFTFYVFTCTLFLSKGYAFKESFILIEFLRVFKI